MIFFSDFGPSGRVAIHFVSSRYYHFYTTKLNRVIFVVAAERTVSQMNQFRTCPAIHNSARAPIRLHSYVMATVRLAAEASYQCMGKLCLRGNLVTGIRIDSSFPVKIIDKDRQKPNCRPPGLAPPIKVDTIHTVAALPNGPHEQRPWENHA